MAAPAAWRGQPGDDGIVSFLYAAHGFQHIRFRADASIGEHRAQRHDESIARRIDQDRGATQIFQGPAISLSDNGQGRRALELSHNTKVLRPVAQIPVHDVVNGRDHGIRFTGRQCSELFIG